MISEIIYIIFFMSFLAFIAALLTRTGYYGALNKRFRIGSEFSEKCNVVPMPVVFRQSIRPKHIYANFTKVGLTEKGLLIKYFFPLSLVIPSAFIDIAEIASIRESKYLGTRGFSIKIKGFLDGEIFLYEKNYLNLKKELRMKDKIDDASFLGF